MVTMKDLLECGVHFGHQTRRWNPKMKKFIFGVRKNIYIIDLQKTLRYFRYTYNIVRDEASRGKTMIFVGTKKQASGAVKDAAVSCGMPYVNHRWLGGMLTNYPTIKKSIRKLEIIKKMRKEGQIDLLTKKEVLMLSRKETKLENYLGGIKDMKQLPDMMFVLDAVKEKIAILEARRLGITVIAPLDTNCDPDLVDYPIPGNDDAIRSIQLFCTEMAAAMNEGKAILAEENGDEVEEIISVSKEEETQLIEEAMIESEDNTKNIEEKEEKKKEK
jgi:small subunit ribosomal protein S2